MKGIRTTMLNGVVREFWKCWGESLTEWIIYLFRRYLKMERISEDWKKAFVMGLYDEEEGKIFWLNYKGINLLSLLGKVYGRM